MTKKEILFVTYQDETFEEGLPYAIYLAGMFDAELRILLVGRKSRKEMFANAMSAVAFAEAGEHSTALQLMADGPDPAQILVRLREHCSDAGVRASVHTRLSSDPAVIKDFLNRPSIDMVLLSPPITKSGKFLRRLVKDSSRPIVTMAQWKNMAEGFTN